VVLIPTLGWLWLYWGWYDEQRVLAALRMTRRPSLEVASSPLSRWRAMHVKPAGFVLWRVSNIMVNTSHDMKLLERLTYLNDLRIFGGMSGLEGREVTDLSSLSRLRHLQRLQIGAIPANDLTPLAGLTNLRMLYLDHMSADVLSSLPRLQHLQELHIHDVPAADLTPLAGLTNLKTLDLYYMPIDDLTPLVDLRQLEALYLSIRPMPDLMPLAGITSLRRVHLSPIVFADDDSDTKAAHTAAWMTHAEALKRARPDIRIFHGLGESNELFTLPPPPQGKRIWTELRNHEVTKSTKTHEIKLKMNLRGSSCPSCLRGLVHMRLPWAINEHLANPR